MTKLDGVHPQLIIAIGQIQAAMKALGYEIRVTDGLRTEAEQVALFAQGRTKPGHIVTHADGIEHKSNHQAHADGFGHAVDCCFVVNGVLSWAETNPWGLYGSMAKALGLKWGGDFLSLKDRPHVELPEMH